MELNNKRIAILGFGKEGQASLEYFLANGITVAAVLDMAQELKPELAEKLKQNNIEFIGGPNYLDAVSNYDLIMRSPGVPRLHPKLLAYPNQENIYSHIKLFFDLCPSVVVAVTGTKGKTTTASLLAHIFKTAQRDVFLGGNIGEPPLNFISQLTSDSVVVLEVSSFQAQDLHTSPHVGVILNVTHDHLDDGTFKAASHSTNEEYLRAKAQLIAHQTPDDIAVLHPNLDSTFTQSGLGKKVIFDPELVVDWPRQILGDHNLENIAAAAMAALALGVEEEVIKTAVASFTGVSQRLQTVKQVADITYVNDSASTNPDATIAAINSFKNNIILIVGGSDKNLDFAEMGLLIKHSPQVKALVVIGQVAPKILTAVEGFTGKILTGAKTMAEIIAQANSVAQSGDTVVLSPAAASFDMFNNSKDRGQQFDNIVNAL